jgi:hypothetical protein
MEFRTKDLLVTALPKAFTERDILQHCLFHTIICHHPTLCHAPTLHCSPCTALVSNCFCSQHGTFGCFGNSCGAGGSACDPTVITCFGSRGCPGSFEPWVVRGLEDLTTVRKELQETLTRLDAIEKENDFGALRTRAEADSLEASLTAALEQVRAQKARLK